MRPLNIAHRGFSGRFPENTMIAFEQAYQSGADGIELDVQLTKDGEVVIFHDATLERMTDGTAEISGCTIAEIKRYPITHPLNTGSTKQYIPTLIEYMAWASDKPMVTNIELKTKCGEDNGLEKKVAEVIRQFDMEDKIIISSFHRLRMKRVKEIMPAVKTGLLVPDCNKHIIQKTKELGMDYIHPYAISINETIIQLAAEYELGINTWTINERKDLIRTNKSGLHAVITDFPDRLRDIQFSRSAVI